MHNLKILKEASVLLIIFTLLFSNFIVMAHKTGYESINRFMLNGYEIILDENFQNNTIPEDWTQNITYPSATWEIDDDENLCHSTPYFPVCCNNINLQDEWLTTPSLNFSQYTQIYFSFFWMMDWWIAAYADLCDLNIYISTNGTTWDLIWCEDQYAHPSKEFESWIWYEANMGNHIDLSEYAGENDVFIGFQYYSNDSSNGCQIYLDDVLVYGNDPSPNPLTCNSNGPYSGKAAETIYFYGDASGGQQPYLYRWDFGDGTSYNYQKNPTHKFYKIGIFNVTLRVTDSRLPDRRFDINYTFVQIGKPNPGPPKLKIVNITGGLGLKATILNEGEANATQIGWEIHSRGGLFNVFDKKENGTIDDLPPGETQDIRLRYYVGFGRMHIKITAEAIDVEATPRERDGLKVGLFIFFVH